MKQELLETKYRIAASRMTEAAKRCKDMTLSDYLNTYKPFDSGNECCSRCWNCGRGGCPWDRDFTEIRGWVAEATEGNGGRSSFKIYFCPQFADESIRKDRNKGYCRDGSLDLLVALAEDCSLNYRTLLNQVLECRKEYAELPDGANSFELAERYRKLLCRKESLEIVLASHFIDLQKRAGYQDDPVLDNWALNNGQTHAA